MSWVRSGCVAIAANASYSCSGTASEIFFLKAFWNVATTLWWPYNPLTVILRQTRVSLFVTVIRIAVMRSEGAYSAPRLAIVVTVAGMHYLNIL